MCSCCVTLPEKMWKKKSTHSKEGTNDHSKATNKDQLSEAISLTGATCRMCVRSYI